MKERDIAVDIVKFFAVFLIINSHADACYPKFGILATGGAIGDSLFMFVSGFTLYLGKQIRFDKNHGFTGGYNKAFEALVKMPEATDLEYFLLINSDIEVPAGWLEPLISWMDSHPDCAACAPKLHSWQDRDSFEYAGAAGGLLDKYGYPFCRGRILKKLEKDDGQYDSPSKVFWATGACLMVRKADYEKMGGLAVPAAWRVSACLHDLLNQLLRYRFVLKSPRASSRFDKLQHIIPFFPKRIGCSVPRRSGVHLVWIAFSRQTTDTKSSSSDTVLRRRRIPRERHRLCHRSS